MSGGDKQIASVSYWLVKVKQCEQGEEWEAKTLPPSHLLFPWLLKKMHERWEKRAKKWTRKDREVVLLWRNPASSSKQSPVEIAITEYTTDTRLDREGLSLCSRLDWFDLAPQDLIKLRPKPLWSFSSHIVNVRLWEMATSNQTCVCVFLWTHICSDIIIAVDGYIAIKADNCYAWGIV